MHILVTWGSKRGGTEGIARTVGEALARTGHVVTMRPAREVSDLRGVDAVVVGGALSANRWHRDARRFVERHEQALRRVPTWLFSSGPLDDSASRDTIAAPARVQALMERIGALGHVTFGGRLEPTATGFPAAAMAREHAGDFRDPQQILAFADDVARELPTARPNPAHEPPGRSLSRLASYAVVVAAVAAVLHAGLAALTAHRAVALTLHTLIVTIAVVALAVRYFAPRGARAPLPTALVFALATTIGGDWLTVATVFVATWATGALSSMRGLPTAPPRALAPTA